MVSGCSTLVQFKRYTKFRAFHYNKISLFLRSRGRWFRLSTSFAPQSTSFKDIIILPPLENALGRPGRRGSVPLGQNCFEGIWGVLGYWGYQGF